MKFYIIILLLLTFALSSTISQPDHVFSDQEEEQLFKGLITELGRAFWEQPDCHKRNSSRWTTPFEFMSGRLYIDIELILNAECIKWEEDASFVDFYNNLYVKNKKKPGYFQKKLSSLFGSKKEKLGELERDWEKFVAFVKKKYQGNDLHGEASEALALRIAEDVGEHGLTRLVERKIMSRENCLSFQIFKYIYAHDDKQQSQQIVVLDLSVLEQLKIRTRFRTIVLNRQLFLNLPYKSCIDIVANKLSHPTFNNNDKLKPKIEQWFDENELFKKITHQIFIDILESKKMGARTKNEYFAIGNKKLDIQKRDMWTLNLDRICTHQGNDSDAEMDAILNRLVTTMSDVPAISKFKTPCDWFMERAPKCNYRNSSSSSISSYNLRFICAPLNELELEKQKEIETIARQAYAEDREEGHRIFAEEKRTLYNVMISALARVFIAHNRGCKSRNPFNFEYVGSEKGGGVRVSVNVHNLLKPVWIMEKSGGIVRRLDDVIAEMFKLKQFIQIKRSDNLLKDVSTVHYYYNQEDVLVEMSEDVRKDIREYCNYWEDFRREFLLFYLKVEQGSKITTKNIQNAYNPFQLVNNGMVTTTMAALLSIELNETTLLQLHNSFCNGESEAFANIFWRIKRMPQFADRSEYQYMCGQDSRKYMQIWVKFMSEADRALNIGQIREFELPPNLARIYFARRPRNEPPLAEEEELGMKPEEEQEAYNILGLQRGCEFSVLKKVYKEKIHELHPDKTQGDGHKFDLIHKLYVYRRTAWKKKKAQ